MNDVYFGCRPCRELVEAGYRWAYSELERRGVVSRGQPVSAQNVIAARSYWSPPDDGVNPDLVHVVLPRVERFLRTHGGHELLYGDFFEITGAEPAATLEWLDKSLHPRPTLRYFTEVLGLRRWPEILEWVKANTTPAWKRPWWWMVDDIKDAVRTTLEARERAG